MSLIRQPRRLAPPDGSIRGFTLIELLTVIAIVGILAGILIPAVGAVRKKASQAQSASDLRQIALAYNNFSIAAGRSRIISNGSWAPGGTAAGTPAGWAQVLAEFGDLNDGQLYFIPTDRRVAALPVIPGVILRAGANGGYTPASEWESASGAISYEMAAGLSPNAQASVTPLVWTRGHDSASGRWDDASPWEGDGGHIAFLDGHVVYFQSTSGQLVDSGANGRASTVTDALPAGATVLKTGAE